MTEEVTTATDTAATATTDAATETAKTETIVNADTKTETKTETIVKPDWPDDWREKVADAEASKILDVISEFPFEYEIKSESKLYSAREAA